jgi:biotin carboxyl carrier protein
MNNKIKSVVIDDSVYETELTKKFVNRKKYKPADNKRLEAFIPGLIQKVYVKVGAKIKKGDKLLILEAMKMQNNVISQIDGTILSVVDEGKIVKKNELLILFE